MPDIIRKSFTPVELKLSDTGEIELAFAQLNVVDHDGDVALPGAFPVKDVPISAYGHTSWDGSLPVGKGTISERGDWAVMSGAFFMDTTGGRETHATVKALGPLAEYSYGYLPVEFSYGQQDGQSVRFLRALDVFEVSPVLRGAGIGTHTLAIKSGGPGAGAPYADHLSWVLDEVKALSDRSRDRAEWRAKEGRGLSEVNRTRLADLRDALKGVGVDLDELLAATEPTKGRRREIEVLLSTARANGVAV